LDSYRLISTYVTDSQEVTQGWYGPHSSAAGTAPGTATYTNGSTYAISAFDVGASFGTGATDVLNVGSPYGSDELNLSSLLAANPNGYSASNAAVFNWNGDPNNPGFGCDTVSINGGAMSDTLAAADWGLVRGAEYAINATDAQQIGSLAVTGFQVTDVRYDGAGSVQVFGAQSGTYDFSHATGAVNFSLSAASENNGWGTQTYVVEASAHGGQFSMMAPGVGLATTQAYDGTQLVTDGHSSLLNFYDAAGNNNVDLSNSKIAANIYLNGNNATLRFLPAMSGDGVLATGGNEITLGSGSSHITANNVSGLSWLGNFQMGIDSLDLTLGAGGYQIEDVSNANGSAMAIADTGLSRGVVLGGVSASQLAAHSTVTWVGSVMHMYVS
jgi:hypothetical protein